MPAIVRDWNETDRIPLVKSIPYDGVTHSPGFGESGYRVEVVERECPKCGFDRMVRRHDVHPESPDVVRYWCLNPNCSHYLGEEMSHAFHGQQPHNRPTEPVVYQSGDD